MKFKTIAMDLGYASENSIPSNTFVNHSSYIRGNTFPMQIDLDERIIEFHIFNKLFLQLLKNVVKCSSRYTVSLGRRI